MPWEAHQDLRGKSYEINRDSIYRILRSYARAEATYNNTTTRRESHVFGPDLVTIEVDWAKVRSKTDTRSKELYGWFEQSVGDMSEVIKGMHLMIDYTKWYNNEVVMQQQTAWRETKNNIDKSVGRGEIALKGAELVRDLSAETLLVGAVMLSGGAALAVLGTGAAMKGAAKYQDTGKWEAGVFTASSELLFGAVKIKVAASVLKGATTKLTEAVLSLVVIPKAKAGLESAGKVLIEGKSLQTAAVNATLKATDPAILALAKELAKPGTGGKMSKLAALALVGAGAIKVGRDAAIKAMTKQADSPVAKKVDRVLDAAAFDRDVLKESAIRSRSF